MAAIRKKYWTSLRITDRGMSQFRFKKALEKESLHMNMNTMKLILRTRPRSLLLAFASVLAAVAIPTTTMAAAASAAPTVKRGETPDLVLYNGKISTVDVSDSTVDAIAIRDGKILATGGNGRILALAKQGTQVIDLHGRRVLPGLIDGHLHGIRMGSSFFFSPSPPLG